MLRKVVLGSGLVALVPTVQAAAPVDDQSGPPKPPPMRPSDLPLYEAPHADYAEYIQSKEALERTSYVRSLLKEPVRAVREQLQTALAHSNSFTHSVRDNYHEFQDRTDWIIKYLREEENKEMRYGAVVMGGLTGFIFGLRGGFIRRLFYAGIGTTALGFVCFPDETREVARSNGALARQYINIAYNFCYGVKPGDPQLEVTLPELSFPKDLSEFVDLAASVAGTVKQAVMPPPVKEGAPSAKDDKPTDKKQ